MALRKCACIDTLYTELDWLDRFQAAKDDGFEAVEFWDWRIRDLDATREAAQKAGIAISGFNGDADYSLVDPTHKKPYLAYLKQSIDAAKDAGVKLQIGFCRRFDHNHRAVYDMVQQGKVGKVNLIKVSSRDPEPPPVSYVKVSGGIFYDMMIHDFDMVRFLAGSEVTEVSAYGSVLVDPGIGEAGDVDTAVVTLKFENGAIGVIDNSRKAVYGYDQRVEVFGSEGCAQDENDIPNTAVLSTAEGTTYGTAYKVMWDRYTGAFVAEMQAFAQAVANDTETPVTGEDGLYPVLMAAAATKSLHEGRPVKISEVE